MYPYTTRAFHRELAQTVPRCTGNSIALRLFPLLYRIGTPKSTHLPDFFEHVFNFGAASFREEANRGEACRSAIRPRRFRGRSGLLLPCGASVVIRIQKIMSYNPDCSEVFSRGFFRYFRPEKKVRKDSLSFLPFPGFARILRGQCPPDPCKPFEKGPGENFNLCLRAR